MSADQPTEEEAARARESAMEHAERMALHGVNRHMAEAGPSPAEQARILEKVLETELEATDDALDNLTAQDFPLSNYEEEIGTTEFKFLQEIVNVFAKARYPHPRSGMTGLARAVASGDASNRLQPLELEEQARDEAYLMGTFARARRGEDLKQQDVTGKIITESHAYHENKSTDRGSLIPWRRR